MKSNFYAFIIENSAIKPNTKKNIDYDKIDREQAYKNFGYNYTEKDVAFERKKREHNEAISKTHSDYTKSDDEYISDKKEKANLRSSEDGLNHIGFIAGRVYEQAYWDIENSLGFAKLQDVKLNMESLKNEELLSEKRWEDFRRKTLGNGGIIKEKINKIKDVKNDDDLAKENLQLYKMWKIYFTTKKGLINDVCKTKMKRIFYISNVLEKAVSQRPDGDYMRLNYRVAAPNDVAEATSKKGRTSGDESKLMKKFGFTKQSEIDNFKKEALKQGHIFVDDGVPIHKGQKNWREFNPNENYDLFQDIEDVPTKKIKSNEIEWEDVADILEGYYEKMATHFYEESDIKINEDSLENGYPSWIMFEPKEIKEYLRNGDALGIFKLFFEKIKIIMKNNSENTDKVINVIDAAIKSGNFFDDKKSTMPKEMISDFSDEEIKSNKKIRGNVLTKGRIKGIDDAIDFNNIDLSSNYNLNQGNFYSDNNDDEDDF